MAETLKKIRRDMSSTERNDKFFPATNQVAMPYSLRRRARACFGARRARFVQLCAPLTHSTTSAPATPPHRRTSAGRSTTSSYSALSLRITRPSMPRGRPLDAPLHPSCARHVCMRTHVCTHRHAVAATRPSHTLISPSTPPPPPLSRQKALSVCPLEWVETWDEQRTNGNFVGVQVTTHVHTHTHRCVERDGEIES